MPADKKSVVFEHIFNARWDSSTRVLSKPLVTLEDVSDAMAQCSAKDGLERSNRNPANFVKDYTRKRGAANNKWPARIKNAGYTVKQRTGEGKCFEFVKMAIGQLPFPLIGDWENAELIKVQSLSMPLASKQLGRSDEAWLTQVAVKLNLIESYFALSTSKREIIEIDHLQMNAKLSQSEIDSIYLYVEEEASGETHQGLILLEAKGKSEDISIDQIINSLKAGEKLLGGEVQHLLPMALKVVAPGTVHVLEFEVVHRDALSNKNNLPVVHEAIIEIIPKVKGI